MATDEVSQVEKSLVKIWGRAYKIIKDDSQTHISKVNHPGNRGGKLKILRFVI